MTVHYSKDFEDCGEKDKAVRKVSFNNELSSFRKQRKVSDTDLLLDYSKPNNVLSHLISNFKKKSSENEKIQNEVKQMSNIEEIKDFYEYTEECLRKIGKIGQPSQSQIEMLQNDVTFSESIKGKKIVVFDLDETLVHCDSKCFTKSDVVLTVNLPTGEAAKIGVNIRPYVYECLKEANKHFVVVAYTASHQTYADTILNYIDPNNIYFSYRLYRNNCLRMTAEEEQIYVKDLRIFKGIDLSDIVIIDNSVLSFAFQLDNGIPILPYYDNKDDNELLILINYLHHLSKVNDIRVENKRILRLQYLLPQKKPEQNKEEHIRFKLFAEEANFYSNDITSKNNPPMRINNSYLSDYTNSHVSGSVSDLSELSEKSDVSSKRFEECQKSFRAIFQNINTTCLNN